MVATGLYSFIIVAAINQRVTDFEDYWVTARHEGYEVYVLLAEGTTFNVLFL